MRCRTVYYSKAPSRIRALYCFNRQSDGWGDMRDKYTSPAEPVLGDKSEAIYNPLRDFGNGDVMATIQKVTGQLN